MAASSASGRTLLSLCHCSDRPAVRVHCFCINCKGKAVNYRTQRAHLDSATFCGAGRADKQASELEFDIETEPTQGGKTFVIFFQMVGKHIQLFVFQFGLIFLNSKLHYFLCD